MIIVLPCTSVHDFLGGPPNQDLVFLTLAFLTIPAIY